MPVIDIAEIALLVALAYALGVAVGVGARAVTGRRAAPQAAGVKEADPEPDTPPAPAAPEPPVDIVERPILRTTPTQQLAASIEAAARAAAEAAAAAAEVEAAAAAEASRAVAPPAEPKPRDAAADHKGPGAPRPRLRRPTGFGAPQGLDAPRAGGPDDLRRIHGIDGQMARALNEIGIFHFDQIAAWDRKTEAWVETHLRAPGCVARGRWRQQARDLAGRRGHLRSVRAPV